jgi:hypothetical protein
MKLLASLVLCFVALASLGPTIPSQAAPAAEPGNARPSPGPVPVIVELFTSEGCSTCPPADALLMQLESEQPIPGVEVIALEEHVDYWNNGGWFDPFSSAEMTSRQQRYAETFHGSPYTPQMVVDGQWQLVGSRSSQAVSAIAGAAKNPQAPIAISRATVEADGHDEWTVTVPHLAEASGDTGEVWVAITEAGLHSNVGRGENAGQNLAHAAVVRQLSKLGSADPRKDPAFSGVAKFSLRKEWKVQNLELVAFVQQKKSRHIVGAAALKVAP